MRRQAANAAAIALALICASAPLQAKPTRNLPHTTAHKLVLTQIAHHATRPRSSARARATSVHQHPSGKSEARIDRRSGRERNALKIDFKRSNRFVSNRKHPSHRRTLADERASAAQAAIEAADHGTRGEPRHLTLQRSRLRLERTSVVIPLRPREPLRRDASITDETSDTAATSDPKALINVGGVLRPTSGPLALGSMADDVLKPILLPPLRLSSLYNSQGRLILPRPLYGSHEILLHQNEMANRDGLDRVQDDADLLDLRRQRKLVALPESEALRVDYRLPEDRRYSRPWTAAFLSLIAADFYTTFHIPLQVDSAVRTVAVQRRLLRINGNAAPTTGETASPHLTGQAVDIAKGGLNVTEIAWMRTYLQPLIDVGKIDVEEEFQQSCFHISVYKSFLPKSPAHVSVAVARQASPESEADRPTN